ncbi:uncharacterized protein G2W53_019024 [Senna tora]|uniref:Uncharacterized protein n=1 Tax=Senna tora TaxID=362788 RepID=A0A834TWZ3_9FABA|nr:uncharacterized protein G2W53_019024 [Senna tora]
MANMKTSLQKPKSGKYAFMVPGKTLSSW